LSTLSVLRTREYRIYASAFARIGKLLLKAAPHRSSAVSAL
jgi:hypothetical protein